MKLSGKAYNSRPSEFGGFWRCACTSALSLHRSVYRRSNSGKIWQALNLQKEAKNLSCQNVGNLLAREYRLHHA